MACISMTISEMPNFLEAIGVEVDPNMVNHPRTSSFVRTDDWDEEAAKWHERKAGKSSAVSAE